MFTASQWKPGYGTGIQALFILGFVTVPLLSCLSQSRRQLQFVIIQYYSFPSLALAGEAFLKRRNDRQKEVSAVHLNVPPSCGKPPPIQEGTPILDAVTDRNWPNKNGEKENVPSSSGLPGGGWSQVRESGGYDCETGESSWGRADVGQGEKCLICV